MKENQDELINDTSKKFNKVSIVSFIVSIIGIFIAGIPCGIIAIITGIVGLVIFKSETERGKWMAITGLIIGVIELIFMVMYVTLVAVGAAS